MEDQDSIAAREADEAEAKLMAVRAARLTKEAKRQAELSEAVVSWQPGWRFSPLNDDKALCAACA